MMATPNQNPPIHKAALLVAACTLSLLYGCATPSRDQEWVSTELSRRTGHAICTPPATSDDDGDSADADADADAQTTSSSNASSRPCSATPPNVALSDGLDEDEAVALALWNSPSFRADMTQIDSARADFEEASRIDNPSISALAPIGTISAAASLVAPLMSIFQLPQRTEAAARALESVAESLVQTGLDLVRDARIAHIDRALADQRLTLTLALVTIANDLDRIAQARATLGDTSAAEALTVRADAVLAADAAQVAQRDLLLANARLLMILGVDSAQPLPLAPTPRPLPTQAPALPDLLSVARAARPDVLAAELALQGAATRAGWERTRVIELSLQTDVQWTSAAGGVRIGGSVRLPIFNQNQGGIGRAEADIARARYRLDALRQRVTLEVFTAQTNLAQALSSLTRYQDALLPPIEAAWRAATQLYQLGEAPYLIVLDAQRRLQTAQIRAVELEAEVRRAHAELERAVGARLGTTPPQNGDPTP